ncbi:hypothetical protein [Streptomyces sp. NPDC093990]|uniref:hypothetical protein n=1 Tax=Streptomyces sp. NPDC093990 TaxID=3155306 RepID=UPI00341F24CA
MYFAYARTLKKTITPAGEALLLRPLKRDPAAWRALLERHRNGRDGYHAAVRDDLALPPDLAVRWQPPPLRPD